MIRVASLGIISLALVTIAAVTFLSDKSAHGPSVMYSDMEDFLALDPIQVEKANPLMAPDRTAASLFVVTDHLRDNLESLLGQLNGRITDGDCDGIKRIATGLDQEQIQFQQVKAQYDTLDDGDKRAVSQYVQERLSPVAAELESKVVAHLMSCEGSSRHYESVLGPVSILQSKAEDFVIEMKQEIAKDPKKGCGVMQERFSEFNELQSNLYEGADKKLRAMRKQGFIIAEEKADLELESRMEPIERKFYSDYDKLWSKNCAKIVEEALAPKAEGGKDGGKEGGSSGSGSGSASASASGSSSA